jgi:hypothetical protein
MSNSLRLAHLTCACRFWNNEFEMFFDPQTGIDIDGAWIDMNEPSSVSLCSSEFPTDLRLTPLLCGCSSATSRVQIHSNQQGPKVYHPIAPPHHLIPIHQSLVVALRIYPRRLNQLTGRGCPMSESALERDSKPYWMTEMC